MWVQFGDLDCLWSDIELIRGENHPCVQQLATAP